MATAPHDSNDHRYSSTVVTRIRAVSHLALIGLWYLKTIEPWLRLSPSRPGCMRRASSLRCRARGRPRVAVVASLLGFAGPLYSQHMKTVRRMFSTQCPRPINTKHGTWFGRVGSCTARRASPPPPPHSAHPPCLKGLNHTGLTSRCRSLCVKPSPRRKNPHSGR